MEDVAQKSAAVLEEYAQAPWVASPGWWFEDHLKYAKASEVADVEPGCQNCRKSPPNMLRCSVCKSYYCDVKCQREAWGKGHKHDCKTIAACNAGPLEKEIMHTVVTESLLRRIRMYLCPYAVGLGYVRGPGFVLLRSNARLEEWVFTTNTNDKGQLLNRNVRLQYLTLGEFDGLAFEDDFELAVIRPSLQKAIEEYDRDTEVLVVVLLSDGLLCGIRLPMVPELKISKSLAVMYDYGSMDGPLQLNVDDDEE